VDFRDFLTRGFYAYERILRPGNYPIKLTTQHEGTGFHKPVMWFMWALDVFAMRYTRGEALAPGAKIQGIATILGLVHTV